MMNPGNFPNDPDNIGRRKRRAKSEWVSFDVSLRKRETDGNHGGLPVGKPGNGSAAEGLAHQQMIGEAMGRLIHRNQKRIKKT